MRNKKVRNALQDIFGHDAYNQAFAQLVAKGVDATVLSNQLLYTILLTIMGEAASQLPAIGEIVAIGDLVAQLPEQGIFFYRRRDLPWIGTSSINDVLGMSVAVGELACVVGFVSENDMGKVTLFVPQKPS